MGESNDMAVQRELGAISATLTSMHGELAAIREQTTTTNGRVGAVEKDVAVLKAGESWKAAVIKRLDKLEGRGRRWGLAIGGPTAGALIGVLVAHHGG